MDGGGVAVKSSSAPNRSFEHVVHAVCQAMAQGEHEEQDPCTTIKANKKTAFFAVLAFCYMFNITSAGVLFLCAPCIVGYWSCKKGKQPCEQEKQEHKAKVLRGLQREIRELDTMHGAELQARLDRNRADFLWNNPLYFGLESKAHDGATVASYSELITNCMADIRTNLEEVKNQAETVVGHDATIFHKSLWAYEKGDVIKYMMDNHGVLNFFLGDNTGMLQRQHRFAMMLCYLAWLYLGGMLVELKVMQFDSSISFGSGPNSYLGSECVVCPVYAMSNAPIQPPCGGIGYEFLDASVLLGIPSDFKFDRAWGEATLDAILSGPEDPAEYSDWRGSVDDTDAIYNCSKCLPGSEYTESTQNDRVSQSDAETTVRDAATAAKLCPLPSDPNYGDVAIYEAWLRNTGRDPDDCGKELWDGAIVDGATCVRPVCLDRTSIIATDRHLPSLTMGSQHNPADCCLCGDDNDMTSDGKCHSDTDDSIVVFIRDNILDVYKSLHKEFLEWMFIVIPAHYVSRDLLKKLFGCDTVDSKLAKCSGYGIVGCSVCCAGIAGAILATIGKQGQEDVADYDDKWANCSNGYDPGAAEYERNKQTYDSMNSFESFLIAFAKSQLLWFGEQLKGNFNPVLTGSVEVPLGCLSCLFPSFHFGKWNEKRNEILNLLREAFPVFADDATMVTTQPAVAPAPATPVENPLAGQVIQPLQPVPAPH